MKLRDVQFNDADEPETMTVQVTAQELALLYGFLGYTAPNTVTRRSNIEWGNLFSDLADDISQIGNRFYDSGWDSPRLSLTDIEESHA